MSNLKFNSTVREKKEKKIISKTILLEASKNFLQEKGSQYVLGKEKKKKSAVNFTII